MAKKLILKYLSIPLLLLLLEISGTVEQPEVQVGSMTLNEGFKKLHLGNQRLLEERIGVESCKFDPSMKDFRLTPEKILEREGYPVETHFMTTSSGYIIQIHRIPKPGHPAVYALPGIFQSSRDYLINCPGRSLGIKLFDAGYDVWLGNFRGNSYARNHTRISPNSRKFWNFTTDDMISEDASQAVDYILEKTGQEKLRWIGFSLGSTLLFGLLSSRPEYNNKIELGITLAPALNFGNTQSPPVRFIARHRQFILNFATRFWSGEFIPNRLTSLIHRWAPKVCLREARNGRRGMCSLFFSWIDGFNPAQTNIANLPLVFGGLPSPTSAKVVAQWFQWILTGKFTKFDYGVKENHFKYGKDEPPSYEMSKVQVPLIIFWGENDLFITKKDLLKTAEMVPNLIGNVRVNWNMWNHIDFLYAPDADIFVYDYILYALKNFNLNSISNKES